MKRFLICALFIITGISSISAQTCIAEDNNLNNPACNGVISTDPFNPYNPEKPTLVNLFNWKSPLIYCYHPSGGYVWPDGTNWQMSNPFLTFNDDYLRHINYYDFNIRGTVPPYVDSLIDFHPKDGWELLHRHTGLEPDELTRVTSNNRNGPYFILYNKYTGTIRVIASFELGTNQDAMITTLKFDQSNSANKVSALLNNYKGISQPLDQETSVVEVSVPSNYSVNKYPFTADFKASYDPCVCNSNSILKFEFSTLNEADIVLEGRLVGTSVPLDGSGNSPLLNREDFLTAVYKNGFTVNGGALTYKNIQKLVETYKQEDSPLFIDLAISALKSVIGSAAGPVDDIFEGVISKLLTTEVGGTSILGYTLPDTLKVSFGAVGAASKNFTSKLFVPDKIPNISFIEAEMVMSGSFKDNINVRPGDIILQHPGSKGSNASNIHWTNYPAYNEALGVFAVLETPQYDKRFEEYLFEDESSPCADSFIEYQIQFKNNLRFYFNPAAHVNVARTRTYAAIVFEGSGGALLSNVNKVSSNTYISDFYPIESLHHVVFSYSYGDCTGASSHLDKVSRLNNLKISLRLQNFYEFESNSYGKVNNSWDILTYPMNRTNVSTPLVDQASLTISGNRNYSSSTTISALDNITLKGGIFSTSSGASVNFVTGNLATITGTATVKPGIIIKTVPTITQVFNDIKIAPVTDSFTKAFCGSQGQYKAKNISTSTPARSAQEELNSKTQNETPFFEAFPNPARSSVTFSYSIKKATYVNLKILNAVGNVVETAINHFHEPGIFNKTIDISYLPAGIYLCSIETIEKREIKRLLIIR